MNTFKSIFKEGRKPQYLRIDKSKEYYNKHVKKLLNKHNIQMYSTENEEKSSVCERWNRTITLKTYIEIIQSFIVTLLDIELGNG